MKKTIHPEYVECTVRCTCGNTFKTRSTQPEVVVDLCDKCHPFYTGQQKLVDTGGRVQRFADKFGATAKAKLEAEKAKAAARAEEAKAKAAARAEEAKAKAEQKAKRAAEFAAKAAKSVEEKVEEVADEVKEDVESK